MYLQKIQKVMKIVCIVLKVLTVMSFVGGGIMFVTGIMGLSGSGEIVEKIGKINIVTPVLEADPAKALTAEGAAMFTEGISLILSGIIFLFAVRYITREQDDGTPFTEGGASDVKKLGIIAIALSLGGSFIQGVVFGALGIEAANQTSNDNGVTAGLLLLFFSLILNYGAQIKDGKADESEEEFPAEKAER